jgi:hypothetical protein
MKKNLLIILGTTLMLSNIVLIGQTDPNKDKHKKRIVLKEIDEKDGKEISIDTTFDAKDQAAVEKYLKEKGFLKTTPPVPPAPPTPPAPPAPPTASVPPPPAPPASPDKNEYSSYSFSLQSDGGEDGKNENIVLNFDSKDLNDALADIGKAIEDAMKDSDMSKADIDKLTKDLNKQIKELKSHQIIEEKRIVVDNKKDKKSKSGKKEIRITIKEE